MDRANMYYETEISSLTRIVLISLNLLNAIFGEHNFFQEPKVALTKDIDIRKLESHSFATTFLDKRVQGALCLFVDWVLSKQYSHKIYQKRLKSNGKLKLICITVLVFKLKLYQNYNRKDRKNQLWEIFKNWVC